MSALTEQQLDRILPFLRALAQGKTVQREATAGEPAWYSVTMQEVISGHHDSNYRIVEPAPKPLERWLNFYDTNELDGKMTAVVFRSEREAKLSSNAVPNFYERVAVHMVEAENLGREFWLCGLFKFSSLDEARDYERHGNGRVIHVREIL